MDQAGVRAVILAAGVGRRLERADGRPKCLLEFGGRTLLARHLALLRELGVSDITVVVGHEAGRVAAAAGDAARCVLNPEYREGSVVSLWSARDVLRGGAPVLLLDADVIYDRRMLARLVGAGAPCALLVDRELEAGDEPVKLCMAGGRIVDFRKRPEHAHEWHGESVGFFRFDAEAAAELAGRAEAYVTGGRRDVEYEEPVRDMLLASPAARFGVVDVTGLPWTEIDFPADVIKAEALLPELAA